MRTLLSAAPSGGSAHTHRRRRTYPMVPFLVSALLLLGSISGAVLAIALAAVLNLRTVADKGISSGRLKRRRCWDSDIDANKSGGGYVLSTKEAFQSSPRSFRMVKGSVAKAETAVVAT